MSWLRSFAVCAAMVCCIPAATVATISPSPSPSILPSLSSRPPPPSYSASIVLPGGTPAAMPAATPFPSPSPGVAANQSAVNGTNQGGGGVQLSLNETCHLYCEGVCDIDGTCYCDDGYMLVGRWTCKECPQGKHGYNCSMNCTCGYLERGNRCNPVTGACICSGCFSSSNCSTPNGTSCINKYLALDNAGKEAYLKTYGVPPLPPTAHERAAALGLIGGTTNAYSSVVFNTIPRTNAKTLLQAHMTFDKLSVGASTVAGLLTTLQNQVKSGQLRTTLIIQDTSSTSATAILNT